MSKWEDLDDLIATEGWLFFTSRDIVNMLGTTGREATDHIAAYLRAQHTGRTSFTLHRTGRTSKAIWHVGARTSDAQALAVQFADDTVNRVMTEIAPTLQQMGVKNPRALVKVEALVRVLVASVESMAVQID